MTYNSEKLPVTVIILSQNEEANIGFALGSAISFFDQIVVIDSFSTDATVDIVKSYGEAEIHQNRFISWADQRNWTLDNVDIRNQYIFFLDADEMVTEDFFKEFKAILQRESPDQIYVSFNYIFLGKSLKYSYGHPKIRRIFKKEHARFIPSGAREYAVNASHIAEIKPKLIHNDRKPLLDYFRKQLNNAMREAIHYYEPQPAAIDIPSNLRLKLQIRDKIWNRLPVIVRVTLYFFYRYIIKGAFLEGYAGFIYIFMFSVWYQMMIDVFKKEKEIK